MQRIFIVGLVLAVSASAGCGDSDDGGATTQAICSSTCARVLDCVGEVGVTQESCSDQCVSSTGNLVCDQVNQGNLDACLTGIDALSCAQLSAGQLPAICDMVCLVRVGSFDPSVVLDQFDSP